MHNISAFSRGIPVFSALSAVFLAAAMVGCTDDNAPTKNAKSRNHAQASRRKVADDDKTPDLPTVSTHPDGKTLTDGFGRFYREHYADGKGLMEELVRDGANPDFFVISCIDPRSGPDLVFDARPGQQFNHQQIAAIVPHFDEAPMELAASLRYAIDVKKIQHLVIMGHSQCGGCEALVSETDDELIGPWVRVAQDALDAAKAKVGTDDRDALLRETERQVVIQSVENVLSYPMVRKAVEEGRLTVSGWYFDMKQGSLLEYDPNRGDFRTIALPAGVTPPVQAPHQPQHQHPHP